MPDFDLHARSPDDGHEGIRLAVVAAIEALGTTADDSYFLTDLLFDLLNSAFTAIDDLTARLAVLETPPDETP